MVLRLVGPFLVLLFAVRGSVVCQDTLTLLFHIPAAGLEKASQDRYGHLYISDKKGNIHKYDSTGKFLLNYSPQKLGNVTLLEAWNTIKIFVFYRDFQEYAVLDRFLGPSINTPLNQDQIGYARQATLASDYNVWVVDETDFSLKKYDRQFEKVLNKTALDLLLDPKEYDINFMREYQNALYVNDRNTGLLVFDAFGSYKKKIAFKGIDFFSFLDDELYYLKGDTVRFFHLYLFSTHELLLPPRQQYSRVFLFNQKLYAIKPEGIDVYQIPKR